jgi:hypothetical protein
MELQGRLDAGYFLDAAIMVVLLRSQAGRVVSRVLMSRHSVSWKYPQPGASFKKCFFQRGYVICSGTQFEFSLWLQFRRQW